MSNDNQSKNDDLHGNAPDCSSVVLLLVDVINDLDFPDNEELVRNSVKLASHISDLKDRCRQAGIPAIYVNDNRGRWRSNFAGVVKHCLRRGSPGRRMVKLLLPEPDDYIVLKPKHSGFYATPTETLLQYIGAHSVILTGLTTNACVLMTASDIYVRDFKLFVPSDCVAALTEHDQHNALEFMENNFAADIRPSHQLSFSELLDHVRGDAQHDQSGLDHKTKQQNREIVAVKNANSTHEHSRPCNSKGKRKESSNSGVSSKRKSDKAASSNVSRATSEQQTAYAPITGRR